MNNPSNAKQPTTDPYQEWVDSIAPLEDWQSQVANGDTRLGYGEWQECRAASPGFTTPVLDSELEWESTSEMPCDRFSSTIRISPLYCHVEAIAVERDEVTNQLIAIDPEYQKAIDQIAAIEEAETGSYQTTRFPNGRDYFIYAIPFQR